MNAASMRPTISAARRTTLLLGVIFALQVAASRASVDDAHSFALQSAEPYVKQGYQVREDYWGGDLGVGEKKAVRQQLFNVALGGTLRLDIPGHDAPEMKEYDIQPLRRAPKSPFPPADLAGAPLKLRLKRLLSSPIAT